MNFISTWQQLAVETAVGAPNGTLSPQVLRKAQGQTDGQPVSQSCGMQAKSEETLHAVAVSALGGERSLQGPPAYLKIIHTLLLHLNPVSSSVEGNQR